MSEDRPLPAENPYLPWVPKAQRTPEHWQSMLDKARNDKWAAQARAAELEAELNRQRAQHLDVVEQISRLQGRAEAERDAALAVIKEVRYAHQPVPYGRAGRTVCVECGHDWPCATAAAVDGDPHA